MRGSILCIAASLLLATGCGEETSSLGGGGQGGSGGSIGSQGGGGSEDCGPQPPPTNSGECVSTFTCEGGEWKEHHNCSAPCPTNMPKIDSYCHEDDWGLTCEYDVDTPCGPRTVEVRCQDDWDVEQPIECDAPCGEFSNACGVNGSCRWLEPACDENPSVTEGCYDLQPCTAGSCPDGETCTELHHDPCGNAPGCLECSEPIMVCVPS